MEQINKEDYELMIENKTSHTVLISLDGYFKEAS